MFLILLHSCCNCDLLVACLKVAVDGGANFVMDQLGKAKPQWPDIITGDFDSIRSDVLTFCQEKVSTVVYYWRCTGDAETKLKAIPVMRRLAFSIIGFKKIESSSSICDHRSMVHDSMIESKFGSFLDTGLV